MRRRRNMGQFHEPSLVPMADMLTNTVGVVLFILIFTVLTAGGAVVKRHLPLERPTKAKPVEFLCAFGRVAPVELGGAVEEFLRPLKVIHDFSDLQAQLKSRKVETDYFILTGEISGNWSIRIQPKPGNGETTADIGQPSSKYRTNIAALDSKEKYVSFLIYPSGVSAFRAARDIAGSHDLGTGWILYGDSEPIRYCIQFCGSGGSENFVK